MGNAEWTGVPLNAILEGAGLKPNAVDVMFEGADEGEIKDDPKSPGEIHFARSLPIAKARGGDVVVAYKMNGAELSPAHGFLVQLVVPGWYGMASIKWLTRIVVTDKPFDGFFQTLQYSHWERPNGTPTLLPVTEMHVKAAIVSPMLDEVVTRNTPYRVRRLAWAGESNIAQVEVSTDGGQKWTKAQLTGPVVRYAWRQWEYDWQAPAPGEYTLMARGTDTEGRTQPMTRSKDRRSYEIDVHGLGFSPDGSLLCVISVTSNALTVVETATNKVRGTAYLGRAPHEAFFTPDGKQIWVAVRGQDYVSVVDADKLQEIDRIQTADGASKVVFRPDGQIAFVHHTRTAELDVIDVRSRKVMRRVTGLVDKFTSDMAVSPDGLELWLPHKMAGKLTSWMRKRSTYLV